MNWKMWAVLAGVLAYGALIGTTPIWAPLVFGQ